MPEPGLQDSVGSGARYRCPHLDVERAVVVEQVVRDDRIGNRFAVRVTRGADDWCSGSGGRRHRGGHVDVFCIVTRPAA